MNAEQDKISIYNNSSFILSEKQPNKISSWINILIIMSIILITFINIPFNIYKKYKGNVIIDNDKSYIKIKFNNQGFPFGINDKLYINNKFYKYKSINKFKNYLLIEVDLPESIRFDNNTLSISIKTARLTILKMVKNKLKKGMKL